MSNLEAARVIYAIYEREDLEQIKENGCFSGAAEQHIYNWQNLGFYLTFRDEILQDLKAEPADDDISGMTELVWRFIEKLSKEACKDDD